MQKSDCLLKLTGIHKSFPKTPGIKGVFATTSSRKEVLKDLDLELNRGEALALAGENAGGKSTLLKLISGLIPPEKGKIFSGNGSAPCKIRLTPSNERGFFWRLTLRQNLKFFADFDGILPEEAAPKISEWAKRLDFEEYLDTRFMQVSDGTKAKASIVRAFISDPDVILLDEVTRRLDPQSNAKLFNYLGEFVSSGKSAIFVTHSLDELKNHSSKLALLENGKIVLTGDTENKFPELEKHLQQNTSDKHSNEPPKRLEQEPRERNQNPRPRTSLTVAGIFKRASSMFIKDAREEVSYKFNFLLFLGGVLFSALSFYFLGQLIPDKTTAGLQRFGGSYFPFALIGLAASHFFNQAQNGISRKLREAQMVGTLEALMLTETPGKLSILLFSVYPIVSSIVIILLYLLGGWLFFDLPFSSVNSLSTFIIIALSTLPLLGIGLLSASFVLIFKRGDPIAYISMAIGYLLSGVYYPIEVLPKWLQSISQLIPMTHSLEGLRMAILAGKPISELGNIALILSAFGIVLMPLGYLALNLAMKKARRDGSLAHF